VGFLKLGKTTMVEGAAVNGRQYFERAARELGIADLDPVAVRESGKDLKLKSGKRESRAGGSIARNIKHLSPEETADRRRRSENFLKQPDAKFPVEEIDPTPRARK
jgi:hypothetical protein